MAETRSAGGFWRNRSVLVTGATGFTGRWLIPELLRRGAKVAALSRSGFTAPQPDVAAIQGSVCDCDLLRAAVEKHRVQTVFHLAAQSLAPEARDNPAATLDVNVRGTWAVLEAARASGECQVLLASSAKVYGHASTEPIGEECALLGSAPYEVSKACGELIARMYAFTYGVPVGIVRCGNLFGGGDFNWSRSVPGMILAALRGETFVIRSDGRALRDYLYVEDAVDGYLRLGEKLALDRTLFGQAFNFGLGRGMSVLELWDLVLRLTGRGHVSPVILGAVSDEVPVQYLDTAKARTLLQWSPRYGIGDGLRTTVSWYREYVHQLHAEETRRETTASKNSECDHAGQHLSC